MEENKKSGGLSDQLYIIFILIGLIALALSYFMVFMPKNDEISTVKNEIASLKPERDNLLTEYNSLAATKASIKNNEIDMEKIYTHYDGDVTYQSVIADVYEMEQTIGVDVDELAFTPPELAYLFTNDNFGKCLTYEMIVVGTYNQIKETLKYFDAKDSKRKIPIAINYEYDDVEQKVTMDIKVNEFAICGVDTEGKDFAIAPVIYPSAPVGRTNIFYSEVLK